MRTTFHVHPPRLAAAALGLLAALLALPASAASALAAEPAGSALRQASTIASPSVVMVQFVAQAYLDDNRDGSIHGPYKIGWQGTGFFVGSDGYIATAAHIAGLTSDQIKNQMVEQYLTEDANAAGCQAVGNCQTLIDTHRTGYQAATSLSELQSAITVFTQNMNVASQDTVGLPAQLKASSPMGQSDVAIIKVNAQSEPVLPLGSGDKVQTQDPVAVIGYPAAGAVSAQTALVPTITSGSITALKQGSAAFGLANGVSIFQTDATVQHGNSGGPAVNESGQAIGLVSFFSSNGSDTTNFLISIDEVRDQLKQAGASNALGQIDRLWRQGMGYFGQQRYVKAKAAFDQCAALNKAQVGCTEYGQKAAALVSQDQEAKYAASSSGAPAGLIAGIAGGLVLLALVGGAVALLLTRRRRPGPPSGQPAGFPPQPGQPVAGGPPAPHAQSYGPASPPQAYGPAPQPPGPVPGASAYGPAAPPPPQPQPAPPQPPAAAPGAPPAPPQPNPVGFVPPQAAEPQPARFCSHCGGELVPGRADCPRCGQRTA